MDLKNTIKGVFFSFIVITVYFFTMNTFLKQYSFLLFILFLVGTLSSYIWKKDHPEMLIGLTTVTILFLVGLTGWFFSPFFNWLYLIGIALAFIYSPYVTLWFISSLVGLFVPSLGAIDFYLDLFNLVSLLSVIPLSIILRHEYLRLRENEKKILILEEEGKSYQSLLEETLANRVTKAAVDMKEPLNDIKQIVMVEKKLANVSKLKANNEKIVSLIEKAMKLLQEFEEQTTGKKDLKNPH